MTPIALTLKGELDADDLVPWLLHRGRLLNLVGWINRIDAETINIILWGPPDLLDAMEVACNLGPASIFVEEITRAPHAFAPMPQSFAVRHSGQIA